ncbi:MAG TPA: lysylphosphatidylglycerol synthase transmembrane domain-containing protein [Gaiellaceae bacterium]|nr:lysylphosphatidylglycerol synthase transmembrane domain-containing protein [Gaiellaceae bacterium]
MSVAADAVTERPERRSRWKRLLVWIAIIILIGALADLLGWNIRGWFDQLWDTLKTISAGYIIAACALKSVQTTAAALSWYGILRFAFPGRVRLLDIVAAYAASVALNSILPANLGTLAMLIMFTTIIAGATFAAILGGYAVQKIFWTLIGAFVYLYLFLSVGGSFDIKFSFVHEHPWATALVVLAAAYLLYVLIRRMWPRVVRWWDEAKEGGAILADWRKYLVRVFTPSLVSWLAGLAVMGVFLAAYDIPVTFNTLMRISGGNSIANVTSVTPGGAGVTQAFNVASLKGVTSSQQATAYSVAQQLVTTAWNLLFGIALVVWAFGWTGGKKLVGDSYEEAKARAAEQKAARDAKRAAKREAEATRPS